MVATIANPTLVLPLVGSIMVAPGFKSPRSSASSIIESATRSFTLPAGLKASSLATIFPSKPYLALYPDSSINGVCPINPIRFFATFFIIITVLHQLMCKDKEKYSTFACVQSF